MNRTSLDGFAFILGVARSGTSILGELLGSHPRVNFQFEAHRIWEIGGGVGENGSHRLTADHAGPEVIAHIREWFNQQAQPGTLTVEKNPRNALRVPYVRAIFPQAKLIHIVRDGRDTACSMVPGCGGEKWQHLKPPSWKDYFQNYRGAVRCAYAWLETISITMSDLTDADHLQIRYEDLIQTPSAVLEKLLTYLELEETTEVKNFLSRLQNTTTDSYHAARQVQWFRGDHKVRVGRYRENLSPEELTTLNSILGPTLLQLGYDID